MNVEDRRLIEDVIPIEAINLVAQREKTGHAATHPRKLHLWWARRPLAAARAAVYATLVPAEGRTRSREEEADFFDALCRGGGPQAAIDRAREEVLAAYGGQPPKVLDMFAGGGAIPLEAARLGCETTAVELNPVAHLIEKCMLDYPQRFPGLADDVSKWGKVWVDRAWEEIKELYPPFEEGSGQQELSSGDSSDARRPLAYLWTHSVACPNPTLARHQIDLVRQTWLARKPGRYVALNPRVDRDEAQIRYEVVEASTPEGLGFDPAAGSRRGQATCRMCGTVVDARYLKNEGKAGRMSIVPLATVVLRREGRGRDYLAPDMTRMPTEEECLQRLKRIPFAPPDEPIAAADNQHFQAPMYGMTTFSDLFTPRQLVTLMTLAALIRPIADEVEAESSDRERASAVATALALTLSRIADRGSMLCRWEVKNETAMNTFSRQALPMVWDFVEPAPFGGAAGDVRENVETTSQIISELGRVGRSVRVIRASASQLPLEDRTLDAVITDPPYYDNISYADLSDFFFVWLKRALGDLHAEELSGQLTPKKNEAIVAPYRHEGGRAEAREFYEEMMRKSFGEAHRVLKPGAPLVCIYAHKTTLGWSTLVDSLRGAGFMITEAWPLDTEMAGAVKKHDTASLASSIFLVARKRAQDAGIGYESDVNGELEGIITDRLERLTEAGITGSDLIIATVGAGLRAFTRYERVEQDNGEELPAERFLQIVQNRVLDAVFGGLQGADPATRFYIAAQFAYGYAWVPFAEANNLGYMTGVEVDGPGGLTAGRVPLVAKEKSKVKIRDFEERGENQELGLPQDGIEPPVIDVAHGLLWRAEYRTAELKDYLNQAKPDAGLLRQVIQALAGKGLRASSSDGKAPEAAAAERLLASWRRLVEDNLFRTS